MNPAWDYDVPVLRGVFDPIWQCLTNRLSTGGTGERVLLLTSAMTGEGVSSVALGLAWSAALAGAESVLLVDGNSASPRLSEEAGRLGSPGLRDLLAGAVTTEQAAAPTATNRLRFLPIGTERETAARRWSTLIGAADWTIVDAGPWRLSSDWARYFAKVAAVAIVAPLGGDRARLGQLVRQVTATGLTIAGVIINTPNAPFRREARSGIHTGP